MKVVQYQVLFDRGQLDARGALDRVRNDVLTAIDHVRWPVGADKFTIYPQSGKKRGEGNGVRPIKNGFIEVLRGRGWRVEEPYNRKAATATPGAFDAWLDLIEYSLPPFVVEWETGNISSSHRAMNKMALGLVEGSFSGGLLALPSRNLYKFLTDRIGNYDELAPYFPMWRSLAIPQGYLAVVSVEHDAESTDVPRIPKGTDGRAVG